MQNTLLTTTVACPVCSSNAAKPLFLRRDLAFLRHPHAFSVVRCTTCGMGYVQDRPTPEALSLFYPPGFYARNHSYSGEQKKLGRKLNFLERFLVDKKSLRRCRRSGLRLLDVGCAGGEFVAYAAQNGWDAYGYEWSQTPPNHYNSPIIHAPTLQNIFEGSSFDAITAWAVLEHAYNLRELTAEISRLLKPGGIFVALVTNFNSIPGRYMQQDGIPRHLNLFTRRSLTRLLKENHLTPQTWSYSNAIFSGSHRGLLVFLLKRLAGESLESIVEQHRAPGKRHEFCTMLRGRPSRLTDWVCRFDRTLFAPVMDALTALTGFGFTMTVTAVKNKKPCSR